MAAKKFRLGLLTSGADAGGMNFAVSAVTKYAVYRGCSVTGFFEGFNGLMNNKYIMLDKNFVREFEDRGGTYLYTARTSEFKTEAGISRAMTTLHKHKIDGLVLIGGDGTFRGGYELHRRGIKVAGIPASIYNDISGTDHSIGFDTALNSIIKMVSKIRDTASSHYRIFIVEVMGKNSGNIAVDAGLASAVDYVLVPEIEFDLINIVERIKNQWAGKRHIIILTSEGAAKAHDVEAAITPMLGSEVRSSVIGYMQRGGSPSALDRLLAAKFSKEAVELLLEGKSSLMVASIGNKVATVPFIDVMNSRKEINDYRYKLVHILSISGIKK